MLGAMPGTINQQLLRASFLHFFPFTFYFFKTLRNGAELVWNSDTPSPSIPSGEVICKDGTITENGKCGTVPLAYQA